MIIKIKSHKKPVFEKILNYMIHDKDRLFDKSGKSFAITYNLKGNSVDEWEKQFRDNELYRQRKRTDSVLLTHEILSWHKDDAENISLAKMEEMAREYIRLRNPLGIYVAVPHFDKGHYHIHICASGIEYKTGRSLRLTKSNLQQLKKDIQQYQIERFPELSKSVVRHGRKDKSVLTDKEYQIKLRTGRETDKEKLIGMLKTCYKKANSKETFFHLLKECRLIPYERGGKTSGIIFNNKKFRLKSLGFTNERLKDLEISEKRKSAINVVRQRYTGKNHERGSIKIELQ
jgi:ferredoxin-fold anticodon binding domain-containing protein